MDETIANEVIKWYKYLEKQLSEFMQYITPTKKNLKVWSFRLAMITIDACGLLDSIFRYVAPTKVGKKKRKDLNIEDFANLYAEKFGLPYYKAIFLISPPEYRTPYKNWEDLVKVDKYKKLPWWDIYNNLKHDRLQNIENATLDTAIDALCGLIQVIAKFPEFAPATLRQGLLKCSVNTKLVLDELKTHGVSYHDRWIETQLFAIYLGREKLPDDIKNFDPVLYSGSKHLCDFVCKLYAIKKFFS